MAALAFEKLMPTWGIEVDHDLSQPLTDDIADTLVELYNEHHLLLFRRQNFSEAQQVAFAKLFGPISHRSPAMKTKDTVLVSNVAPDGVLGDGELLSTPTTPSSSIP